jgi:hypothetical protein
MAQEGPQAAPQSAAPSFTQPNLPQKVKTAAEFVGDYKTPRTADGKPDLHGFWTNATVSRMDRPNGYPLILTDEQAAQLEGRALFNVRLKTERSYVDPKQGAPEKGKALPGVGNYDVAWTDPGNAVINIKGELRSAYITFPEDGRTPGMTEEGRKLRASAGLGRRGTGFDNPEERGMSERCIVIGTNGPPFGNYLYNNNFQIMHTPDAFVVMSEMIHDVRVAPIGGKPDDRHVEQYMGRSTAHWDGDTMVVETRGGSMRPGSGAFVSDKGKVIERFTRIADDEILYEFEVNDPTVYTSVYKGQTSLHRLKDRLYEYACHEGNYGLLNILEGGRNNDRKGIENKTQLERGE